MVKVLVADDIDESGLTALQGVAEVHKKVGLSESEICEIIGDYEALMVRSATKVTSPILTAGKKLKIVGRAGVGVDNIDVRAATELGIYVVNSPQGNIIAAAEHTLGMMMSLSRCMSEADRSVREGKWERSKFVGAQLHDKCLGIVGLGQVGTHVAKVADRLGMRLMVYDPYVTEAKAKPLKCSIVKELNELLKQCDYLTLHVPKLPETNNLINKERLSLMKPTARIINTSRGGVIDEAALAEALRKGELAGAALDVYKVEEAFASDNPLLNAPNLLLTPHIAASTTEAQINVAKDVAQQIVQTFHGTLPSAAVNLPGLRSADLNDIRCFLNCAATLGRVAAQLLSGPIEDIHVILEGQLADLDTDPILLSAANGAIGVHLASNVTFVNVRQVADKYKIAIRASTERERPKGSVRIQLKSNVNKAVISGAVTDDGQVLLKYFQGVGLFMPLPEGSKDEYNHLFYSKHLDNPGMLGRITTTLGANGYNIANCHLGRCVEDGRSYGVCIFHIDNAVSEDMLQEMGGLDGVVEVHTLKV